MKKALIQGTRICQIEDVGNEFEVTDELQWVDVDDTTTTKDKYVDGSVEKFIDPYDDWFYLRGIRDELLAGTDWWAVSDRTMTPEQSAYRQALRDLPANTTDPANPVWPTKPS